MKKGALIIVSGLSGVGKTSIVERSIAALSQKSRKERGVRIITCTTRKPRPAEVDGKDYRFLSRETFERKLRKNEFAEHAEVYGNLYGTLAADIEAAREKHPVSFLILDIQGKETLARTYPEARTVLITIPSRELLDRLKKRGESRATIARRTAGIDDGDPDVTSQFNEIIENRREKLDEAVRSFLRYVGRCCPSLRATKN